MCHACLVTAKYRQADLARGCVPQSQGPAANAAGPPDTPVSRGTPQVATRRFAARILVRGVRVVRGSNSFRGPVVSSSRSPWSHGCIGPVVHKSPMNPEKSRLIQANPAKKLKSQPAGARRRIPQSRGLVANAERTQRNRKNHKGTPILLRAADCGLVLPPSAQSSPPNLCVSVPLWCPPFLPSFLAGCHSG
jgi:hypothetical protein